MACAICRKLLSEGLDLCIRARKMDARQREADTLAVSSEPSKWVESGRFAAHAARNNIQNPHAPMTVGCATPYVWEQEQYEQDLFDWENRSRQHLTHECPA